MRSVLMFLAAAMTIAPTLTALAQPAPYDVAEKDIATLQADMRAGRVTAAGLVQAYEARIAQIDPLLHSVIVLNPDAMAQAQALDAERKAGHLRGALHGIPILVKDNIETLDPMPTTAGSLALANNVTHRDAPVVARLRAAGAIILGKTNLSEWANIRSTQALSGWSAIGGVTHNPYVLDRSTCGSSAGSGAAVAASLAAAALGTETNGSLVCPGSFDALVTIKPTLGLVSRTHIVPISHTQDTPGPMTRSVADAALLLAVMAGSDPLDTATTDADNHTSSYALGGASLAGKRLGLIIPDDGKSAADLVMAGALAVLKAQGAEIIEIPDFTRTSRMSDDEGEVLKYELKNDMAAYLQSLPGAGPKTLADLIAFNAGNPRELVLFGQDYFEMADKKGALSDPAYIAAHDELVASTRNLIDTTLSQYHLDALIRITEYPSFRLDVVRGDTDAPSASFMPAAAGYPHVSVPMGFVQGLPLGLSFMGPAWSDEQLLNLAAAFERAAGARKPPAYLPSLESRPDIAAALAPLPH